MATDGPAASDGDIRVLLVLDPLVSLAFSVAVSTVFLAGLTCLLAVR